ncbi:hypothetical protein ES288_D01G162600v1 [Gossypium darwinii]|uniref:Non-haem dioxygenase N-terminal domain-containing protein n=1 Tax=Gossypium darwinii TaxID=34276 RepID=A0A5D2DQQ4_GOSDA|nr:hypothetical protein ES288_D01G162600v1 [Gossypium darwinii]
MEAISSIEDKFNSTFSVQELVKESIITIPQHYVHLDQQHPSPGAATPFQMLPIIDMNQLIFGEDFDLQLEKLHSTCKEWGFFQLVNHGIKSSILERLKHEVEGFYKLPLEEKMKYKIREGEFEGYRTQKRGGGKFDWCDKLYMMTNPILRRKPHLFPKLPSSLRLQELGTKLLSLIAKALKINEKEMIEYFEDGMQSIRMTYYPPCPQSELVMEQPN